MKALALGSISHVRSDKKGGCLVAGSFSGAVTSGSDTLKPYRADNVITDALLVYYNDKGQKQWWLRFSDYWDKFPTTFYQEKVMDLECDGKYAYLLIDAPNKGPKYFIGPAYSDSFQVDNWIALFKIDLANGNVVWRKIPKGDAYGINQLDFAVNKSGECAFHFSSTGNLDWGNGVNTNKPSNDASWIVKIASDGTSQWATMVNSFKNLLGDAETEIDDNGEVYFSAKTPNAYDNKVLGIPVNCKYIGKLKSDGSLDWVRKFSDLTGYFIDIALHKNHIYFRGDIGKTSRYIQSGANDSMAIKASGNNNSCIYFGRFDGSGKLDWHVVGTGGSGASNGIPGILRSLDDGSGVFCIGGFQANSTFGNFSVPGGFGYYEKFILLKTESASAGIQSVSKPGFFEVYPNPSSGNIHIRSGIDANLQLLDNAGRLIEELTVITGIQTFQLDLPAGIYFIKNSSNNTVNKLIITN